MDAGMVPTKPSQEALLQGIALRAQVRPSRAWSWEDRVTDLACSRSTMSTARVCVVQQKHWHRLTRFG